MSDDPRIVGLEARVVALEDFVKKLTRAVSGEPELAVANASDLDSQYGDEEIKVTIKRAPRQFKGHRMSETTPEFLDIFAEALEWMAGKNDEKGEKSAKGTPISVYNRKSAARARGWAARLRAGWKPKERPRRAERFDDDAREPTRPSWMDAAPPDDDPDMKFPPD